MIQLWATASQGPALLQRQIAAIDEERNPVAGTSGIQHIWRSRPPEHFSLPSSPQAQCHFGSPQVVDPPSSPALPSTLAASASTRRNPRHRQSFSGGDRGFTSPLVSPAHAATSPSGAPIRESALRGRGRSVGSSQLMRAAGGPPSNLMDGQSLCSGGRSRKGAPHPTRLLPLLGEPVEVWRVL